MCHILACTNMYVSTVHGRATRRGQDAGNSRNNRICSEMSPALNSTEKIPIKRRKTYTKTLAKIYFPTTSEALYLLYRFLNIWTSDFTFIAPEKYQYEAEQHTTQMGEMGNAVRRARDSEIKFDDNISHDKRFKYNRWN